MPSRRALQYNRYPPILTPSRHPDRQPLILPPQLDPSCVLCLLPLRDNKWFDYSGKGNHGTVYGATKTSKGRNGFGWEFDGLDDYVDCGAGASLNITDEITIEAWVNVHNISPSDDPPIIVKRHDTSWDCYLRGGHTGSLAFFINGGQRAFTADNVISQDTWHYIVFFYDKNLASGNAKIYIDSIEVASGSYTDPIGIDTTSVIIGVYYAQRINGLIDEVRIYNRALSAWEIKALYEMGIM